MKKTKAIIISEMAGNLAYTIVGSDGYVNTPGVGYILDTYYLSWDNIRKIRKHKYIYQLTPNGFVLPDEIKEDTNNTVTDPKEFLDIIKKENIDYIYAYDYEDGNWIWAPTEGVNATKMEDFPYSELDSIKSYEVVDRDMVDNKTYCSYKTAVNWGGTHMVLLNNIIEIDEEFYLNLPYSEDEDYPEEYFQYFITDLSDGDVEWRSKVFPDLTYAYSNLLDRWFLCVDHYGTSWDYVRTQYVGYLTIPEDDKMYQEDLKNRKKITKEEPEEQEVLIGSGECPMCGEDNTVSVKKKDLANYEAWKNKTMLVQDAFPNLTPEAREVLISGLCLDCQASIFAQPDEDDESWEEKFFKLANKIVDDPGLFVRKLSDEDIEKYESGDDEYGDIVLWAERQMVVDVDEIDEDREEWYQEEYLLLLELYDKYLINK